MKIDRISLPPVSELTITELAKLKDYMKKVDRILNYCDAPLYPVPTYGLVTNISDNGKA